MDWNNAFERWCPITIIDAGRAPRAEHVRNCYKTAFQAGFEAAHRDVQRETAEECIKQADRFCCEKDDCNVETHDAVRRVKRAISERFGLKESQ